MTELVSIGAHAGTASHLKKRQCGAYDVLCMPLWNLASVVCTSPFFYLRLLCVEVLLNQHHSQLEHWFLLIRSLRFQSRTVDVLDA